MKDMDIISCKGYEKGEGKGKKYGYDRHLMDISGIYQKFIECEGMRLNQRQIKAVFYVKEKGKITNKAYQEINQVSKPTATRELKEIEEKKIFEKVGITGKGTFYSLKGSQRAHNGLTKGSQRAQARSG